MVQRYEQTRKLQWYKRGAAYFFAVFSLFLAWIDGFFVLFEIWLIMKNMYIFPFKSDEKNCIMDL